MSLPKNPVMGKTTEANARPATPPDFTAGDPASQGGVQADMAPQRARLRLANLPTDDRPPAGRDGNSQTTGNKVAGFSVLYIRPLCAPEFS